jgi:hypothetical protein
VGARLQIADSEFVKVAMSKDLTNRQFAIRNPKIVAPTRYREVVLTPSHNDPRSHTVSSGEVVLTPSHNDPRFKKGEHMPTESAARGAKQTAAREPTKLELQRQMQQTRESLTETIGEIKQTVEQEYSSAKKTVSGVLNYREQFKDEPLVWSLGALSAGFALGYTLGYSHRKTKGGKQSPLGEFADSMVEELSTVGQGLVMPALNVKIKELFGFDFAELLDDMGKGKRGHRKTTVKKIASTRGPKKPASRKKRNG